MKLRAVGTALTVISTVVLCIGASLTTARAAAVWHDLTSPQSAEGLLKLESDPANSQWLNVQPGADLHWLVTAALSDTPSSSLELEVNAEGQLVEVAGMKIEVRSCNAPFTPSASPLDAPNCSADPQLVQPSAPLTAVASNHGGGMYVLDVLEQGHPRFLLVTLSVPASADPLSVSTGDARIGVGLHAAGASAETPPQTPVTPGTPATPGTPGIPPALATTGADLLAVGVLAAGGLGLTLGLLLLRRARRSSRDTARTGGVS